ncbi:recombinase family protein [Streptomyces sp. CB02923]|uniref:recombinase family protein n=1 Tax=Streptomyces sp. CB02923 TaxID=1718985 RepID=UPI000AF3D14B|nr:recombinase family protein [Streptomyces sp. CB02923]
MANLVYKRFSTDQQSTARQDLVLAEAGIEDPIVFEEEAGTSSRLHPLERPKFGKLLDYARPGRRPREGRHAGGPGPGEGPGPGRDPHRGR